MGKNKLNFSIDALMLLGMALLSGTGFLMKFVLLPGKERAIVYGPDVQLYLFGFDRHEWGTFHLYIAYVLIALLILHIILHLKWIFGVMEKFIAHAGAKSIAGILFVILCLFLALFPFIITPEISHQGSGRHGEMTERDGDGGRGYRGGRSH